jgi:hypothetical protein
MAKQGMVLGRVSMPRGIRIGTGQSGSQGALRRAETLDAQDVKRYGKGILSSDLPDELQRLQERLARNR